MARHPFGPRAGRRTRNRTYTILVAVLVIGVVIAFYYGPFGKNEADTIDTAPPDDTNVDTTAMDESEINREPVVIEEPEVIEKTVFEPPVEAVKEPELPKIAPEPAANADESPAAFIRQKPALRAVKSMAA